MEGPQRDLVGEVLDSRFRVQEKLGSGGMGEVWRVEHVVSLQAFALKTLDPACARQDDAAQRLLREARAAASLRTRHVVQIVDAQIDYRHKGVPLPFLVMELLEGKNLQQLFDERGRLDAGELIWAARQLARALDAAHQRGIVHRDLKPSNIFVAIDDEGHPIVKLCDFGIAKLVGRDELVTPDGPVTRSGALLGTPMYLAPELLRGGKLASPPTDQWSLGLVVFRALAGIDYFGHTRGFADLVLTIANDPVTPPSRRVPGLPTQFDPWFLRSCARRPEDRFPDVPTQIAALEAALGHPSPRPLVIDAAPGAAAGAGESVGVAATVTAPRRPRRERALRVAVLAGVGWAVASVGAIGWLARAGDGTPRRAPSLSGEYGTKSRLAPSRPPSQTAAAPSRTAPMGEPAPASALLPPVEAPPRPASVRGVASLGAGGRGEAPDRRRGPASRRRGAGGLERAGVAGTPAAAPGKPKGDSCARSAECASGLCVAETCQ